MPGMRSALELAFQQVGQREQRRELLLAVRRYTVRQPAVDGLAGDAEHAAEVGLGEREQPHQARERVLAAGLAELPPHGALKALRREVVDGAQRLRRRPEHGHADEGAHMVGRIECDRFGWVVRVRPRRERRLDRPVLEHTEQRAGRLAVRVGDCELSIAVFEHSAREGSVGFTQQSVSEQAVAAHVLPRAVRPPLEGCRQAAAQLLDERTVGPDQGSTNLLGARGLEQRVVTGCGHAWRLAQAKRKRKQNASAVRLSETSPRRRRDAAPASPRRPRRSSRSRPARQP